MFTDPGAPDESHIPTDQYCPKCGYNVRGAPRSPGRCPECGSALDIATLCQLSSVPYTVSLAVAFYAIIPLWLLLGILPYYVNGRVWYDSGIVKVPLAGSVGQVDEPDDTPPFNWPIVGPVWYWISECSIFACLAMPLQVAFGVWLFLWLGKWEKRLLPSNSKLLWRFWFLVTLAYVCELFFGRRALSWLTD